MRIIPAIDILEGKCVRLTQGDFSSFTIYNTDPLEVAKELEGYGLKFLHLVDLDGVKNRMIINYRVLDRLASKTSLAIDFGGGIRSDNDLKIAFSSGAKQVSVGSAAVSAPDMFLEWLHKFGTEKIILGADCRNRKIAIDGWKESTENDILDFLKYYATQGLKYSVCTDTEKDGMMNGPASDLYREILSNIRINLIAGGGISSLQDIQDVKNTGCEGVIIGKAIYEGKIKLKELGDLC